MAPVSAGSPGVQRAISDCLFKGANPGDLPIEQPTRFELVPQDRPKALGLTIPPEFPQRADQ